MITQHAPVLIPVLYMLAALVIPLAGYLRTGLSHAVAVLTTGLVFAISLAGLLEVVQGGKISYFLGGWMPPLGIELVLDPLSALISVVISGSALFVMVYARDSVSDEMPGKTMPFYSLSMLLLCGLAGMTLTGDFFNLYVFLEITALAGYGLLAIGNKRAPFSAFRYLTLGTAGAAFYLLGVAFIFIATGSLNMVDIGQILPLIHDSRPVTVGLVLIVLGVCIKMGIFPLHQWLPDAYTHASSAATALIAPVGTKVAVYVLIRTLIIYDFPPIIDLLSWVAALSIVVGSILAITQSNIKRMLAYSSVANIGYITLGITLANPLAFIGALLHIINHALMKMVLFMVAGGIFKQMGTLSISRLRGFPTLMPFTALAFIIAVLSMIGIPPTGGFFSKLYLILGAVEAGAWFFVFAILLSTLLAIVYLFRVINIAFFRPYEKIDDAKITQANDPALLTPFRAADESDKVFETKPRREMGLLMLLPALLGALVIVLVGVYSGLIVESFIEPAIPEIIKSSR